MSWDDTIADALDRQTASMRNLAKQIQRMCDLWEPVVQGLLDEQAGDSRPETPTQASPSRRRPVRRRTSG